MQTSQVSESANHSEEAFATRFLPPLGIVSPPFHAKSCSLQISSSQFTFESPSFSPIVTSRKTSSPRLARHYEANDRYLFLCGGVDCRRTTTGVDCRISSNWILEDQYFIALLALARWAAVLFVQVQDNDPQRRCDEGGTSLRK